MKRSLVYSSLVTTSIALGIFLVHGKKIASSNHQHQQTVFDNFLRSQSNTNIAVTHPHEWPASMYKDALLYNLRHHDSHVLDKNYLVPLFLMANRDHAKARQLLQHGTTDADLAELVASNPEAGDFFTALKTNNRGKRFFYDLADYIQAIDVTPSTENEYRNIPYHSYYADKKQSQNLEDMSQWSEKQRNVYQVLKKHQPKTVLDLGANLGWFSFLANNLNAKVIATDVDEFCMNMVYQQAKDKKISVTPAVTPFQINASSNDINIARLKSDVVMCLALVHHLVFIAGMKLEDIMETLANLTNQVLILEFVDIKDANIQRAIKTPSRFKNGAHGRIVSTYENYAKTNYTQSNVLNLARKHFRETYILPSEKESRKLIVLIK